jgi:hypothetical protein
MVEKFASCNSKVVDNTPHIPKIKGLSPVTPLQLKHGRKHISKMPAWWYKTCLIILKLRVLVQPHHFSENGNELW